MNSCQFIVYTGLELFKGRLQGYPKPLDIQRGSNYKKVA